MSKKIISLDELCGKIEKYQGKSFVVNIINGANTVVTFDKLDFADVKMGNREYLAFNTYEDDCSGCSCDRCDCSCSKSDCSYDCSCTINIEDIVEIYEDVYMDTNIVLDNGQVIQMELSEN